MAWHDFKFLFSWGSQIRGVIPNSGLSSVFLKPPPGGGECSARVEEIQPKTFRKERSLLPYWASWSVAWEVPAVFLAPFQSLLPQTPELEWRGGPGAFEPWCVSIQQYYSSAELTRDRNVIIESGSGGGQAGKSCRLQLLLDRSWHSAKHCLLLSPVS